VSLFIIYSEISSVLTKRL